MKRLFMGFLVSIFMISQVSASDQWAVSKPAGTDQAADIDSYIGINNAALDRLVYTYRQGCKIVYASVSTLTVEAGALALPNSAGTVVRWRRNTSSTTVAWTNIDTGSEASSTTYYVYAVADADATTFTIKISTNSAAPTGCTYYRRLGYFYNDASSNITQIVNDDNAGNIAYVKGQGNYYKIDTGSVTVTENTAPLAVSFDFTYATAPKVFATIHQTSVTNYGEGININSVSTTGFTITIYNFYNGQSSSPVEWLAVGEVLAQ